MGPQGLEREVMWAMKRFGKIQFCNVHRGISHGEFLVMVSLDRHAELHDGEGMRAAQLAQYVKASPQALSRTLRSLEEKGFIERKADPTDRRHTCISLTEAAQDTIRAGQQRMKHIFDQAITQMGEENVRTMVSLVNQMSDIMQDVQAEMGEDTAPFLEVPE